MKNIFKPFLIVLIVLIAIPSVAQKFKKALKNPTAQKFKKVLEIPAELAPPQVQDLKEGIPVNYKSPYRKEGVPWIVYSDRVDNTTENGKVLNFMDSFYVVDETATKVYIVKAVVDGLKIKSINEDVGWIKKTNLLLWSEGLIDIATKINLKGFLLNKKESIPCILTKECESDRVKIFNSPDTDVAKEITKNRIYDFFFIFKTEDVGEIEEMYLLSKNVNISPDTREDVIGWVKSDRITNWNTRIALEPNFDEKAFTERKQNTGSIGVKLFDQPEYAIEYANGNNDVKPLWSNDPVSLPTDKMAAEDPYRFKGGVIRFPNLNKNEESNYYKTAVVGSIKAVHYSEIVGEINEEDYAELSVDINKAIEGKNITNILFVVDATKGMQPYIKSISNTIYDLKDMIEAKSKQVKFGAAIYEDANAQKFEYVEMTDDEDKVIDFLRAIESKVTEASSFNSLFFGLNQALIKSNLRKNHTNIVIVVGDTGDDYYIKGETGNTAPETIEKQLDDWEAHIIALNCNVTGAEAGKAFTDQMTTMIKETATLSYNIYSKLRHIKNYEGFIPGNPEFNNNTNELKNGSIYGACKTVNTPNDLENEIISGIKKSIKRDGEVGEWLTEIFENGNSFDSKGAPGSLGPAIIDLLGNLKDKLSEEDLENLSYEKYQFYLEAYAPIKINAAVDECFSDVLFMPRKDLDDLVGKLDNLARSASYNPRQKRQAVIDTWYELLKIYTGETNIERLDDLTIEKLNAMMQGVEKEGIKFNTKKPLGKRSIRDLRNKRVVTDEEINDYIREITRNYRKLEDILRQGRAYEFSYSSNGNTYYWIPSDYLP